MNNLHNKIDLAVRAPGVARFSFVRRCALAVACGVGLLAIGQAPVAAQDAQRGAQQQQQQQNNGRAERGQAGRSGERQFDPRAFEARADEQRRQLQMQQEQNAHGSDAGRRSGRMTPDERRDLRRQINEAGTDIYPNAPRR